MGDPEEPTVKERRMSAPTVDYGGSPPKNADPQPSTSSFDTGKDRFETRGELGRGGMGRVDEAFDRALGRQVAIKHVLSPSEIDLQRFEREARITARLEHPGIVPVHDIGRGSDGTPYYVMRRVDGQPLSDLIEGKSLVERLRLVPNLLAACDAAAFAHSKGIVHRDIKPTNILVGPYGETLLIDWGLAREVQSRELQDTPIPISDPNLTRAGTVAGTPGFMSPEQARGETVDARADVFALGATLFYVLAGKLPWHGGSTEMIDHVGAGRPADWRLMPAEVPADLRAVVEKAMATDLAQRYPDAAALAADLRAFTLGNLVVAYEYGWFQKLVRFVRRHRAPVAVGAISLVVLAIVGVVSVRRVIAERDDANAARTLAEKRQKEARDAADRLLVAHARDLVNVDPTEAIAALRTVPADSEQWPHVWAVASAAYYKGIPIGFVGLDEPSIPQIAADNAHAFVAGMRSGHLILIDITKRESRDLGKLGRLDGVGWLDSTHIIAVLADSVAILDIANGSRRTIAGFGGAALDTNREGRAVLHHERRLYELTSADEQPVQFDENVDLYEPSPDLRAAVIGRGSNRELVTGGTSYPLPAPKAGTQLRGSYYLVRDTMVAALDLPDAIVWDLVGDKIVERGRWKQPPGTSSFLYVEGLLFTASIDGYQRVDGSGRAMRIGLSTYRTTRTGILLATLDGQLLVRNDAGTYRLGRRRATYARFDHSNDGRYVMATTLTNEVLIFDVGALTPRPVRLDVDENAVRLTKSAVWTLKPAQGYIVRNLEGTLRVQLPMVGMMSRFVLSVDERAAAGHDVDHGTLTLAEVGAGVVRDSDVTAVGATEDGIVYAKADGGLWSWKPTTQPTQFAKLGGTIEILVAGSQRVLATLGDAELVRIDRSAGTEEHATFVDPVSNITIGPDGTAWAIANGKAYRWKLGEKSPTALITPEPVDGVTAIDTGALFHSPRSLLVYESDEPRIIAIASQSFAWIGGQLVALLDARGAVSIVDLQTFASFELPLPLAAGGMSINAAEGGRIGYISSHLEDHDRVFGITELVVPQDPVKLRAWLATITNAKPVPGSEAVAWP